MSFWDQLKQKLAVFFSNAGRAMQRLMSERYGADQLSLHLLILGIVFYLISLFTGFFPLSLASTGLYIYTAFRMLSKNRVKRAAENTKYLSAFYQTKQKSHQTVLRLKNRKEYKYFRCPQCKALLRMKRGSGTMHVTCGKCKHQFDQKA